MATYVDDILALSRDPMSIINDIQKSYMLKGIGVPEYYLGGNYHTVTAQNCKVFALYVLMTTMTLHPHTNPRHLTHQIFRKLTTKRNYVT